MDSTIFYLHLVTPIISPFGSSSMRGRTRYLFIKFPTSSTVVRICLVRFRYVASPSAHPLNRSLSSSVYVISCFVAFLPPPVVREQHSIRDGEKPAKGTQSSEPHCNRRIMSFVICSVGHHPPFPSSHSVRLPPHPPIVVSPHLPIFVYVVFICWQIKAIFTFPIW